jgi:hypothetical protein
MQRLQLVLLLSVDGLLLHDVSLPVPSALSVYLLAAAAAFSR